MGRRMRLTLLGSCILVLPVAVNCSGPETEPSSTNVDSMGVTIVRSTAPLWEDESSRLGEAPVLELVSDESSPETVLFQVTGVALLPDGRIVVANRGDASVRLYDASGRVEWRAGREGDGPGEFRDLRGVVLREGELWAYQTLPLPIHVFGLDGSYRRSVDTPHWSGPWLKGILSDGSIVAITRAAGSSGEPVFTQYAGVVLFKDDVVDTLAALPFTRRVNTSLGPEWQGLGPSLSVAASAERIFAGFSETLDIHVWDESGRLIQRIRRAWDPVEVSVSDQDAYTESLIEQGEGRPAVEAAYRQLAEEMIYPEAHPAHDRLLAAANGELWVQRPQIEPPWSEAIDYNPVRPYPSDWDIFSRDGRWLGTVTVPARFRVMDVTNEHVAGVAKDGLNVERVQIWRVRRPG